MRVKPRGSTVDRSLLFSSPSRFPPPCTDSTNTKPMPIFLLAFVLMPELKEQGM